MPTCMYVLQQGDTPLYWASRHGHDEVVVYLCDFGVDINHQDKVCTCICGLTLQK